MKNMVLQIINNSINEDNKPFWDFINNGEFRIQKCDDCEKHRFPSSYICPHCTSTKATWCEVSGYGEVYTWTNIRKVYHDSFKDKVPYNLSVIRLDEGVQMISNVVSNTEVEIGMRVKVVLEDIDEEHKIPKFIPVRSI